jgi:stage IV sporulation protein FB
MLFAAPTPTRYDLRFTLAGIPIRVHPLFWLIAVLFGASSGGVVQLLIWVGVVFVSILVHELGHAFAMRWYGRRSQVILYGAGGLTVPESVAWGGGSADVYLGPTPEIIISLAGPGAGFLLAALVLAGVAATGGAIHLNALFGVIPFPVASFPKGGLLLNLLVVTMLWVNIFWGLINLMPVYPLDGGNVARFVLLKADPLNGVRNSLWVSVITGTLLAIAGLTLLGSLYMALLFGFLAFQSFQSLGRTRGAF